MLFQAVGLNTHTLSHPLTQWNSQRSSRWDGWSLDPPPVSTAWSRRLERCWCSCCLHLSPPETPAYSLSSPQKAKCARVDCQVSPSSSNSASDELTLIIPTSFQGLCSHEDICWCALDVTTFSAPCPWLVFSSALLSFFSIPLSVFLPFVQ